jgi:hypothetical protein
MPKKPDFNRDIFAMLVERNAVKFENIKEMFDKQLIGENDMLFTLEGVIALAAEVYKAAWTACAKQPTPAGKWSLEVKYRNAKRFITDAY